MSKIQINIQLIDDTSTKDEVHEAIIRKIPKEIAQDLYESICIVVDAMVKSHGRNFK